jgi:hypothetical protein
MMSHQDLIFNPEKYEPLGSVKSVNNKSCDLDFTDVNIEELFKSQSNMRMLSYKIHKIHRQNGGRSSINKFYKLLPTIAKVFCKNNNINEYEVVEINATHHNNWVETLKAINNEFTKVCYKYLKWNTFVPTREMVEVGPSNNRKQVRLNEIQAPDQATIDVWSNQETQIINKHFRYGNKIPIWQKSMNKRHYDRGNEGLVENDPDRSSLDTPIYGYNMEKIYSVIDKWNSTDWFGY